MRSLIATIVAVAFLANASLANAQDYATTAPLPGYCPWQSEGPAFDLADALTEAKCASDRSQRVTSELIATVAERPVFVGPREMAKPSGIERQITFKWFPTVMTDPDAPGAVVFAMNQYKPYRDIKDANAAWTSTVSSVGEALAPIAADRIILIGPKWMTSGAAAGVKSAIDITGQAAFAAPFAMAAPLTAGMSLMPLTAMYAEALFMAPTGSAHGASEFVDGVRERNYERALEGAAEFCGNVGVVMLAAGGAASTAGKAIPPARAPIALFEGKTVPALPPTPVARLPGSGPAPGVIEVSDRFGSVRAFQRYDPRVNPEYGSRTIEFVYDTKTKRFAVGEADGIGSPHENLAAAIGADDPTTVVGGLFSRGGGGEIITNEMSGHFGHNWTKIPGAREEFVNFLQKRTGQPVEHTPW